MTSKGQVTFPKSLRESLGIHEGDRIEFNLTQPGQAQIRKMNPDGNSSGVLKHLAKVKPVSTEDMDAAIAKRIHGRLLKK